MRWAKALNLGDALCARGKREVSAAQSFRGSDAHTFYHGLDHRDARGSYPIRW